MAVHRLIVFSAPTPGQEDEYNDWYNNVHLDEVVAIPGFVSRSALQAQRRSATGLPAEPTRVPLDLRVRPPAGRTAGDPAGGTGGRHDRPPRLDPGRLDLPLGLLLDLRASSRPTVTICFSRPAGRGVPPPRSATPCPGRTQPDRSSRRDRIGARSSPLRCSGARTHTPTIAAWIGVTFSLSRRGLGEPRRATGTSRRPARSRGGRPLRRGDRDLRRALRARRPAGGGAARARPARG